MGFKRRVRLMFDYLSIQPGDKVLDAGCGRGFFLKYVTEIAPCNLSGVDLEFQHLRIASERVGPKGVGIACSLIGELPFADDTFDKVIFSEVLEHLPDDVGGLSEVKRVLKPGGTIFLTVPNHNYPFWWDPVNRTLEGLTHRHIQNGAFAGIWANHVRLYYPDEIKALVKRVGLETLVFEPVVHFCFPFAHNLVYGLGKPLFEGGFIPKSMQSGVDRFEGGSGNKSLLNPLRWGLLVFNGIDSLNHAIKENQSFVINALKVRKPA
jgi:ubiquinone/menaquinone biosynthesis C-methylase UbiE